MIFAVILPVSLIAQTTVSKKENKQETINKKNISFEEYCLENALRTMVIPSEKRSSVKISGELEPIKKGKSATYTDYGLTLLENETQYFSVKGSDDVIAVQSLFVLRLNYNNSKK